MAFDINSAVEVNGDNSAIPTTKFDITSAGEVNPPAPHPAPHPIAGFLRGVMKHTAAETAMTYWDLAAEAKKGTLPHPNEGEDFGQWMERVSQPREEAIINQGVMRQVAVPMAGSMAGAAIEGAGMIAAGNVAKGAMSLGKLGGAVGAYSIADHFFDARRWIDEHAPQTPPLVKDLVEIADFAAKAVIIGGSKGVKDFVMDRWNKLALPKAVHIDPQQVELSKGKSSAETLGIQDEHAKASVSSQTPVQVPVEKVVDLAVGTKEFNTAEEYVASKQKAPFYLNEKSIEPMVKAYQENNPVIMNRPIALVKDGTKISVLEGEHRLFAARKADVEPPMVLLTRTETDNLNAKQIDELAKKKYSGKNESDLTNFYKQGSTSQLKSEWEKLPKSNWEKAKEDLGLVPPEPPPPITLGFEDTSGEGVGKNVEPSAPQSHEFVQKPKLSFFAKENMKTTADEIRKQVVGSIDEQVVKVNQWAESGKKAIKSKAEQEGMFWYASANGDRAKIIEFMTKMEGAEDPKVKEYYEKTILPQMKAALELSPEAIEKVKQGSKYYAEAGQVAKELGTIRTVRENYQSNRIYKPEPPEDFIATGKRRTGIHTSHAKQRVYETPFDAVMAGKKFATTNYFDALTLHNEEMAFVNTSRAMLDQMEKIDVGEWSDRKGVPQGYKQVGDIEKDSKVFVAPEKMAAGLEAITDPNNLRKVKELTALGKFNGFVKSFNVALSFFHHFQFVKQTLSSKNGEKILANFTADLVRGKDPFETKEFKQAEQDWASWGLRTSARQGNFDITADLMKVEGKWLDKLKEQPGIKQVIKLVDANNHLLFDRMQRYFKVMAASERGAGWLKAHPEATETEVVSAHRAIARAINNTYGGLNWEMLGVNKTRQGILRLGLFAPDWLLSAIIHTKDAAIDWKSPAGHIARANIVKGVLVGGLFTELLNKTITGHYTDENKKGHQFELEAAPNVYINFFGGATGELIKFVSNVIETGGVPGAARYFQGKVAPLGRFATMLLTSRNYAGQNIANKPIEGDGPIVKSLNYILNLASTVLPLPFGAQSAMPYKSSGEETRVGDALVATGLGRYSTTADKGESSTKKIKEEYFKNKDESKISDAIESGDLSEQEAESIEKEGELSPVERKAKHMTMTKAIQLYKKSNDADKETLQTIIEDKYDRKSQQTSLSPKEMEKLDKEYSDFMEEVNNPKKKRFSILGL
jgi:hypothetical protein